MRTALVLAASLLSAASALAQDVEHQFQSVVPRGQVQRVLIDSRHEGSGPVYRVVGGAEAEAMAAAIEAGRPYRNNAATQEAPGHRA